MRKVLQRNTVYGHGSTGKIVESIYGFCKEKYISCTSNHRYDTGVV